MGLMGGANNILESTDLESSVRRSARRQEKGRVRDEVKEVP